MAVKVAVRIVANGYVEVPDNTGNQSVDEVVAELLRIGFPDLTDITVEVIEEEE
jgi:hypothetical protein